ncbi:MAG: lipoate--protein ligase family protein [Candidatus Micrarchaeia archaeon]
MKWRILNLDTFSCYMNMAIDETISEGILDGSSVPTIRFYKWNPGAVSIGRFQSMNEEVNIESCKINGIEYVRRITGGGAVYHDTEGEITYSIIGNESLFNKGIIESYKEICAYVIDALGILGIDASFHPINDILVNNKKISGNAQQRKNKVLLQHGTILVKLNVKKMFSLLNVSKEKISDKLIKNVEDRVTCIENEKKGITQDMIYNALIKGFTKDKECYFGELTSIEKEKANTLSERYKSDEWNFYR